MLTEHVLAVHATLWSSRAHPPLAPLSVMRCHSVTWSPEEAPVANQTPRSLSEGNLVANERQIKDPAVVAVLIEELIICSVICSIEALSIHPPNVFYVETCLIN